MTDRRAANYAHPTLALFAPLVRSISSITGCLGPTFC
jgi:hypothetical protein